MSNKILIPEEVKDAWEKHQGPVVFATVAADGTPNAIYATCVSLYKDNSIIVANNYFCKTLKNIESGSKGSILFLTPENKSYQIKGSIKHVTSGDAFDNMKSWNPKKLPGKGAAVISIEEIYSGAKKIL